MLPASAHIIFVNAKLTMVSCGKQHHFLLHMSLFLCGVVVISALIQCNAAIRFARQCSMILVYGGWFALG